MGSYSQAIGAFEKTIANHSKSPSAPKAAFEIGQCWNAKDNPERNLQKAISAYKRVAENYPKSVEAPRALYETGKINEESLKWQEAADAYGELLKKYPESEDVQSAQLLFGRSLHQLVKYSEAINAYNKILNNPQKYKKDIEVSAQLYKAESLYEMEQYENAAEAYLRVSLVYFDPDLGIYALSKAGDSYEELGRWSDAIIWYRKILKDYADPNGEYYKQKKSEWDTAINFARKRLEEIEAIHKPGGDAVDN